MLSEPEGQGEARSEGKKTMSVNFEDRSQLGRFCWIFLRNALKDPEWRTRACAAWAIGVAADRLPREFIQPAVDALSDAALDRDGFVRFWIIDTIGKLGSEAHLPIVRAALNDKDDYVRINAAKALSQLGQPEGSKILIDTLALTPSAVAYSARESHRSRRAWKLKVFAIECLGEIGSLAAIAHISAMLRKPNWPIRASSAWALGMIGDRSSIPSVRALLHDREKLVRMSAAEAMGRLGEEGAVALLKSTLLDEDKKVKFKAAESLAKLGYRTGVQLLADALTDPDISIQSMAVTALGKLADVSVRNPLSEKLESEDWQIRADSAIALGRIGGQETLTPLKKRLEDAVKNVRVCAAAAILMILGR
ncbi:MAG: HEAT repeat domain-containing protein [Candidatus Hydrogenedentota bacterium]|nr:MAG: HEAT repeat domain-containing protein [Candidatus Hydrogenedentota bacterium]